MLTSGVVGSNGSGRTKFHTISYTTVTNTWGRSMSVLRCEKDLLGVSKTPVIFQIR